MKRKYQVKTIVPATVVKSFEVEATSEAEALALYLQGEAYLIQNETTSHDDDVEFRIEEI
jgi:calcineurin-like phosphoesterase